MGSAKTICKISFLLVYILFTWTGIQAQDHTIPGEITTPFPTLKNLAVEWDIQGDDNLNGRVEVAYRVNGTKAWKEGMPLFRVPAGDNIGFTWNNKHSGSIFDLDPDTGYEIRLRLSDPDGGSEERTLNARTRPVPKIDNNAYIIELQAGTYDTLFTRSGTENRPIVYRCSEGKAVFKHIDLHNREWVFIDGLTVINLDDKGIAIQLNGSENCVIQGCTIDAIYGIVAYLPGATNCYIGLSSQPGLGGPNYFVRNAMYNLINGGLKLQRYSQGDVILHNTMIKIGRGLGGNAPMDHAFFRNNLAIGGPTTDVEWGKWGVYDTPYIAKIGDKDFSEVEKHGVEKLILHDVFSDIEFPNPPVPERDVPDLRPKAGSRVEDAAVIIPNINDNYKGLAPDCGAYEVGQQLPLYGPRTFNLQ
jgi:hypothetical protein